MINEQKTKPGKGSFLIGIAVIIGGLLISVGILIYFVFTLVSTEKIPLSSFPGKAEITLAPGKYALYYEYKRGLGEIPSSDIPELHCSLVFKKTGEQIGFIRAVNENSYSNMDRSGKSLYHFEIQQAGNYEFSASFDSKLPQEHDGALTIGENKDAIQFLYIFILTSIIEFVSIISGSVIIIVTFIKRRKAKAT